MVDDKEDGSAAEFLQVFRRGVQFTEKLLAENERLRFRVAQLEEENKVLGEAAVGEHAYRKLADHLSALEQEKESLERTCAGGDKALEHAERYRELEAETDRLANLYVAINQLHSTLDAGEVVRITFEILINLVGAQDFALLVEDGCVFSPACTHGKDLSHYQPVTPGQGLAGAAIESGEVHLPSGALTGHDDSQALACIPLRVAGRVIGLFEVRSFLLQKESFSELDAELVRLVSFHAGMALFASALAAGVDHQGLDVAGILRSLGGIFEGGK
jgi:hypothetical protein